MRTERRIRTSRHRRHGRRGRIGTGATISLVAVSLGALLAVTLAGADLSAAGAATPTVEVATNATFGTILTTDSGMALYTLDTDHNGQSTCHGACAAVWPPLNVPAGTVPTGGPGVTGAVGASPQSNGTVQVTYNGSPVYTFVSDIGPGQVTGNGVTGFFVVTVAPAATTTTTAPPPGGTTAGSTPTSGGAPAPGSPTSAPTAASTGQTSSTAPSARSAVGATPAASAASGTLAFTGTGPGLWWLALLGLILLLLGALLAVAPAFRSRRAT